MLINSTEFIYELGCSNFEEKTGDSSVYIFSLIGHVCGIFLSTDQIVHYASFWMCILFGLPACMLVQKHSKSLCWTLALFSKRPFPPSAVHLDIHSFYSQKYFIFTQYIVDGFVKLLTDNHFFKVII